MTKVQKLEELKVNIYGDYFKGLTVYNYIKEKFAKDIDPETEKGLRKELSEVNTSFANIEEAKREKETKLVAINSVLSDIEKKHEDEKTDKDKSDVTELTPKKEQLEKELDEINTNGADLMTKKRGLDSEIEKIQKITVEYTRRKEAVNVQVYHYDFVCKLVDGTTEENAPEIKEVA